MNCDIRKELDHIESEFKRITALPLYDQRLWLNQKASYKSEEPWEEEPEHVRRDIYEDLLEGTLIKNKSDEKIACLLVDAIKKDIITPDMLMEQLNSHDILLTALFDKKKLPRPR